MLGLPLVPSDTIETDAKAAFFSQHALADSTFSDKLMKTLDVGKPVLITSHLAEDLKDKVSLDSKNLQTLKVGDEPRDLYNLTREQLDPLRKPLLAPFGIELSAPSKVALYLYSEDVVVIENFNDTPADITFRKKGVRRFSAISLKPMDDGVTCEAEGNSVHATVPPRSLCAFSVMGERRR